MLKKLLYKFKKTSFHLFFDELFQFFHQIESITTVEDSQNREIVGKHQETAGENNFLKMRCENADLNGFLIKLNM